VSSIIKPFYQAKAEFEEAYVRRVLKEAKGNVSHAAKLADKDRKDFYSLMNRTGVVANEYRPAHRKS
jgi:two-component system response regulator GlrR